MRDTVQPYQAGSKATGVKKWVEQYHKHRPASEGLQLQVDRFMEMFETREQKEKEAMKDGPVVDDEGFTLVQYKKKSTKRNLGNVGGDESVTENKKKKRKTETEDFYKFQARKAKEDSKFMHVKV